MRKLCIILLFLGGIGLMVKCSSNTPKSKSSNLVKLVSDPEENCPADSSLFPIRAPLNLEPDSGKECQFYQWAWATFLYATQDSSGSPRFLSYETPTQLFPENATPQFDKKAIKSSNKMLLLSPRLEEDSVVTGFAEVEQATTKGILIDKNGRAVYYAQHINKIFASFVRDNNFTDTAALHNADPNLEFPTGSLELKTSWKIVDTKDDVSSYYTTDAMVAQFETITDATGKSIVVINPKNLKQRRVALLGMHVVGVTKGHPEFIWATFEHDDLAPNNNSPRDKDWPSNALSGSVLNQPLDSGNYLFYANGVSAKKSNNKTGIAQLTFQDATQQTFKQVSNIFHQYWFDDDGLIESLNRNVKQKLGPTSVWSHYSFKGAVWLNSIKKSFKTDSDFADMDKKDSTTIGGEKALSNVTMETFKQSTQRCFSCHKTSEESDPDLSSIITFPAKKINVSHVLTNAYFNLKRGDQIAKAKLKQKNKG